MQTFSQELIIKKLPQIFVDSLIVDLYFNIQMISQNVLDHLEFSLAELLGKNLNYLAGSTDIVKPLTDALRPGYFNNLTLKFYAKSNHCITASLEGFHSGLVSNFHESYILKINNLKDLHTPAHEHKKTELDKFIYRVAHDIRGPVATLQGLINLMKIRDSGTDIDLLIELMDAHARKLDERLFQMVYLSKTGDHDDKPKNVIDFSYVEKTLRTALAQNTIDGFVTLHYTSPKKKLSGINELHFNALLVNVLLYFLFLPKTSLESKIDIELEKKENLLVINILADGFQTDDRLQKAIVQEEFFYTDIIHYPRLLHFYACKKIAQKLMSTVKAEFIDESRQVVSIMVPIEDCT